MPNVLDHKVPVCDIETLQRLAGEVPADGVIVEIGSWTGISAKALAEATPEGVRIYCVDHWQGNREDGDALAESEFTPLAVYETFCENLKDYLWWKVVPVIGYSSQHAKTWCLPIDLLYIDGDHRYQEVSNDILLWREHVVHRGIVSGHDYGVFDGVTRAVDKFYPQARTAGHVWWTCKV